MKRPTLRGRGLPLALFRLITWLIHAVLVAFASALVDVFTHVSAALIALAVMVAVGVSMASAFGIGGFGLFRRWRRRE